MRLSGRSLMIVLVLLVSTVLLAPTGSAPYKNRVQARRCPDRSVPNHIDHLRSLGLRAPLVP